MANTAKDNVISFGKPDSASRKSGNEATVKALDAVRELCRQRLSRNLRYMMTKCDDALYGCAQMAESRVVHDLYMDAIPELKALDGDLERRFIDRFVAQFNLGLPRHLQQPTAPGIDADQNYAAGAASKHDRTSEDLAVCRMIDETRGECAEILLALDRRMGFLMRDPDLELWQNPVNPEPICEAFRTAVTETVSGLKHGSEIRPVLFNLFDEHVLGDMNSVYRELNLCLIRMGVQPQLQASAPTTDSGDTPGLPGLPLTDEPKSLPGAGFAPAPAPVQAASEPADATRNNDQAGAEEPLSGSAGTPGNVTVDTVAALFGRILGDSNIADSMRALLRRFQVTEAQPGDEGTQQGTPPDPEQDTADPVDPAAVQDNATPDDSSGRFTPGHDRFIVQARQLQKGTWIEILGRDGKTKRAKLSWMSPITQTYLFTDQKGLNAGNYSIEELAQLFRSGRARRL